jgi:diguanylate cyclase (GGDEF)-like protein
MAGRQSARGVRRHLSLLVPALLVLLIGGLGLVAGQQAGQQSRDVHRDDRLMLQVVLAGLTEQYALVSAAEVFDALMRPPAGGLPFSARPDDPATVTRLQALVNGTRALDVGAVLVNGSGTPLARWSVDDTFPSPIDPGWQPLMAAVKRADGSLPLSGVLRKGPTPLMAMGLPVQLDDGTKGMVLGLWDPKLSALQDYVADIDRGPTGSGYVVDAQGTVIAGTDPDGDARLIGRPLEFAQAREQLLRGTAGVLDTTEGDRELVTTFAKAGTTGWTALGVQGAEAFEGALIRSSRLVQAALVALLLAAGAGLVGLHRRREQSLYRVARRDELTGLYNRRGWFAAAERELEQARRTGSSRALLFVDLDGLKQVNDVLGHREGDRAIQDAARVLASAAWGSDVVGRLGGDEFVLLIGEHGQAEAARVRLAEALAAHNAASDARFELRLSVGAEVWFPDEACTLDELVRRADAMMYVDKSSRPDRSLGLLREQDRVAAG